MTDINAAAIVSYVKHWDNDTKGTMEFANTTIAEAQFLAETSLIRDAIEDGFGRTSIDDLNTLFTITKVEFGVPSNWLGV